MYSRKYQMNFKFFKSDFLGKMDLPYRPILLLFTSDPLYEVQGICILPRSTFANYTLLDFKNKKGYRIALLQCI